MQTKQLSLRLTRSEKNAIDYTITIKTLEGDLTEIKSNPPSFLTNQIVNKKQYMYSFDGIYIEPTDYEDIDETAPIIFKEESPSGVLYNIYITDKNPQFKNLPTSSSYKNIIFNAQKAESKDRNLKIATDFIRSYGEGEIPIHHLINVDTDSKYTDILLSKLFDKL